jgi:uncharacterized phage protein (TIGR02218 family)|tara:strand:- start:81825 stop:82658 length:834 start_codon:yes stop_codon:yes gene_type:complete
MRQVPEALAAALSAPVTSIAWLWRVVRADGVALGFTTHDRPLRIEGLDYLPAPGMVPSAVVETDGLDVEGLDVAGFLSSEAIRAEDVELGRYDGAHAELMLVDWSAPTAGKLVLMRGTIGEIVQTGNRFETQLKTAETVLARAPVELTTPECRARLGDARCGVDLAKYQRQVRVVEVVEAGEVRVDREDPDALFSYGRLRPLSGRAAGTDFGIARSIGDTLMLDDDAYGLAPGDRLILRQGCDRRWATCRERFQNGDNFRGEPHVPGRDAVLRYPGL